MIDNASGRRYPCSRSFVADRLCSPAATAMWEPVWGPCLGRSGGRLRLRKLALGRCSEVWHDEGRKTRLAARETASAGQDLSGDILAEEREGGRQTLRVEETAKRSSRPKRLLEQILLEIRNAGILS